MLVPSSILVPVDFGAASDVAVAVAGELARKLGVAVHLLHVSPVEGEGMTMRRFAWLGQRAAQSRLDRLVRILERRGVRHVGSRCVVGDRVELIVEEGRWGEAQLIVLGLGDFAEGTQGFDRAAVDAIIERTTCLVLVVHAPTTGMARAVGAVAAQALVGEEAMA